jgi:hypothetical protein
MFAFPFGYKMKKCTEEQKTHIVNDFIMKHNKQSDFDINFVIRLNSDFTLLDQNIKKNPVLDALNPELFFYFYCLQYTEFHEVSVRDEKKIIMTPRI